MIRADLHIHTTWCDGKSTPEEVIKAAIDSGMDVIGFSSHSYTSFEPYGLNPESEIQYRAEIAKLKIKYADKIKILLGIEQDDLSDYPASDEYDYIIGSVHCIPTEDEPLVTDHTPEILDEGVQKYFGGDYYAYAEKYFERLAKVVENTNADVIAHFDCLAKFNEKSNFFDEEDPRYVAAWKKAADELLKTGKPFEINTGAISRGWRTDAYPAKPIRDYLKEHGAKFILSSDSHTASTLECKFADYSDYLSEEALLDLLNKK